MLKFERIECTCISGKRDLDRAKVPGGWLVIYSLSITFYPDPKHEWDGSTLGKG